MPPIHEQIKTIREMLKMSQRELSRLMAIEPSTLNRIEKGDLNASLSTLEKFASATNTTITFSSEIINEETESSKILKVENEKLKMENQELKNKLKTILSVITDLD